MLLATVREVLNDAAVLVYLPACPSGLVDPMLGLIVAARSQNADEMYIGFLFLHSPSPRPPL
jgi:hypothetical protein